MESVRAGVKITGSTSSAKSMGICSSNWRSKRLALPSGELQADASKTAQPINIQYFIRQAVSFFQGPIAGPVPIVPDD
jgi:hypothetical protein